MPRSDVLFAALVLAAGVGYEAMALRMPQGKIAYPGPGFFPAIVGAVLVLTAAACLVQAVLRSATDPRGKPRATLGIPARRRVTKTVSLLALLVLYVLALKPVGFPIAILTFLVASIRTFGYRKWLPALGIAAVLSVLSYLAFVVWLKVPLPLGMLAELLD